MKVHYTFKHMDATDALKQHVNEKTEKLNRYVNDDAEAHWVFYLEADIQVADVRVKGPHLDFFAQAKTPDLYQSIEEAAEKIEKQLRKNKEMLKDHLHRNRTPASGFEE